MRFKVYKKFGLSKETLMAQFAEQADARIFIEAKLKADALLKINAIYRLFEFDDLIVEYNPEKKDSAGQEEEKSSQGKGSSSGFRPTPFNTAPRPSSMPHKWTSNADDNEDDEDSK